MSKNLYLPEGAARAERTAFLNERMRAVKPAVCLERARLITESYMQTEGQPWVIRRAAGLRHILENMTVFIDERELIVGNHASHPRWAPLYPDTGAFSAKELELLPVRDVDRLQITAEQKRELLEDIYPWWQGRSLADLSWQRFSAAQRELFGFENNVFNALSRTRSGYGHYLPDIKMIIEHGFCDVSRRAEQKLAALPAGDEHADFYRAALIICAGVKTFAGRYARLAAEQCRSERDPARRAELALIERACKQVPWQPARNFPEAVQSYWFTLLIDYIFQNGSAISCGRPDQFWYPFYRADIDSGALTRDEAQQFVEALFVKHNDVIKACTYNSARNNGGFSTSAHMIVGGLDRSGNDACNELTMLMLDADRNVFDCEPNIGVRVSVKNPDALPRKVFDTLADIGGGKYPLFNDEVIIDALTHDGLPLELARDYSIVGCVEPSPYGCSLSISNACYFNLAKCLELALNDGRCALSGKQIGPHSGDAAVFASFDEVVAAYEKQLCYFVGEMCDALNVIEKAIADYTPHIYCSLLLADCIERGVDAAAGGSRYNYCGVQGVGSPDVGDSLAAIKKCVFEDKSLSMARLVELLRTDFEGGAKERRALLAAPKYGNDDDYADMLVRYAGESYCREVALRHEWRGGKFRPGLYCVSANTPIGRKTGALPSGRGARTPLADGGISPKHGMDKNGPTAVFRSAAKYNLRLVTNGVDLNMKLLPSLAAGDEDRRKLVALLRGYFAAGGMHVQFNVLSDEMLRDAQRHPENYRSLVVRVAGYSAFFIDLDKDIQNEIIARNAMN